MSPQLSKNASNTPGNLLAHDDRKIVEGQYPTYDVLVIGAGPSGLMLAQALGRLGIRVRVIERRVLGSQYGNADGLQPRTLEIWESYGILNTILAKGACMRAMVAYETSADGKDLIRQRPSSNIVVPCRYQYEVTASITDIEGTLRKEAESSGVEITQPCRPTSLEVAEGGLAENAESHPVKVTLEHLKKPTCECHSKSSENENSHNRNARAAACECHSARQGTPMIEVVKAKYVVGADGASSWVRRELGIEMQGEQTEDVWGVVDVLVDTDLPDCRFKCVIRATSGAIIIIPREGDKIRMYVQLSASDCIPRDSDGKLDRSSLPENQIIDTILLRIREGFSPFNITFTQIFWSTIFSTAQRVASTFSYKNRVFIAGDACHTHSPNAGQGANASMGDAHNLAWKLAYVLRGWADPSILQTYEVERREYALNLISFDRNISRSLEGLPAAEYQRSLHRQNMFTSGIGITYANSPLTVHSPESVNFSTIVPGERVPPTPITRLGDWAGMDIHDILVSDGLFKLLIFPGDISLPKAKSNLCSFANAVREASESLNPDPAVQRLQIYTILRSRKEDVIWTDVPACLSPSWRTCFTIRSDGENVYDRVGCSQIDDGTVILVRPDGYISLASCMTPDSAQRIISFVIGLRSTLFRDNYV